MKTREIRCLNNVKTRNGKDIRCGSFLMEIDPYFLKIKCRRCGMLWMVSKDKLGSFNIQAMHDTVVSSKKEEKDAY